MKALCKDYKHLAKCTWPKTGEYVCGCLEYPDDVIKPYQGKEKKP